MTIKVTGMMCKNCDAHVKKALEAIDGVKSAVADHEKGTVSVELDGEVSNDTMQAAIVDAGYEVTGFEA